MIFYAIFFRFVEFFRVLFCYYHKFCFLISDTLLISCYFFCNAYKNNKRFMVSRGEKNIYVYGETPLTSLDYIACKCHILSDDVVYDLGCGCGRTLLWLRSFIGCQVVGVDYNPTFEKRFNNIKKWLRLDKVTFLCDDICEVDLSEATVIYLYGTCLGEEVIQKLLLSFKKLQPSCKIITVSYSLTEYSNEYILVESFFVRYPWGRAEVFIQKLNQQ